MTDTPRTLAQSEIDKLDQEARLLRLKVDEIEAKAEAEAAPLIRRVNEIRSTPGGPAIRGSRPANPRPRPGRPFHLQSGLACDRAAPKYAQPRNEKFPALPAEVSKTDPRIALGCPTIANYGSGGAGNTTVL